MAAEACPAMHRRRRAFARAGDARVWSESLQRTPIGAASPAAELGQKRLSAMRHQTQDVMDDIIAPSRPRGQSHSPRHVDEADRQAPRLTLVAVSAPAKEGAPPWRCSDR
jgi:hypothetical protein